MNAGAFFAGFSAAGRIEPINRLDAVKLAAVLAQCGISADQAEHDATDQTWLLAASAAKVTPPSAATRQMVVEIMRRRG